MTKVTAAARVSWLLRLVWPTRSSVPQATAALWCVLGSINLVAAVADAIARPYNQEDLTELLSWLGHWSVGAGSPYTSSTLAVDYPPYVLVVLRWIGWIPAEHIYWIYPLINGALAAAACWQLTQWLFEVKERPLAARDAAAIAGMMLATRAIRFSIRWGQTTPFALLLFAVSMRLARRRPVLAGLLFAVASYKLNLAAGVGTLLALSGAWSVLAVAGLAAFGLSCAFAASIGQSVFGVLNDFVHSLTSIYGGADFLPGATGVRTLLMNLIGDYDIVRIVHPLVAAFLLISIALCAYRARHTARGRALSAATALVWSLVSLTHQRYSALLMLPALWLLLPKGDDADDHRPFPWVLPTAALLYLVRAFPISLEEQMVRLLGRGNVSAEQAVTSGIHLVNEHGLRVIAVVLLIGALRSLLTSAGLRQPAFPPPASVRESSS